MAAKAPHIESPNGKTAEKLREKCNHLSESERSALLDKGMELIYGSKVRSSVSNRR